LAAPQFYRRVLAIIIIASGMVEAGLAEELGWFSQLSRTALNVAAKAKSDNCPRWIEKKVEWRSFDLADAMEMGMSREITTGLITPKPLHEPSTQLILERSRDRSDFFLKPDTEAEPMLMGRVSKKDNRIDIYIPMGGDPPIAVGPAFSLSATNADHTAWTLTSQRCECCEYLPQAHATGCSNACKRELAHIRHIKEKFHGCNIMRVEVDLPSLDSEGSPNVWCTRSAGRSGIASAEGKLHLVSRRPRWSAERKGLTQDFQGRCSCASSKNIQLDSTLDSAVRGSKQPAELLQGKIGENTFTLDYQHPLGMAQAFAIALSSHWWD